MNRAWPLPRFALLIAVATACGCFGGHSQGGANADDVQPDVDAGPSIAELTEITGPADEPASDHVPVISFPAPDEAGWVVEQSLAVSFRECVVLMRESATVAEVNAMLATNDLTVIGVLPGGRVLLIRVDLNDFSEMAALLNALAQDPSVEIALPEFTGQPDVLPQRQGGGTDNRWTWDIPDYVESSAGGGNWGLELIRMPQVWNLDTYVRRHRTDATVSVGVVDSGYTDEADTTTPSTHPDFTRRDGTVILQIAPSAGQSTMPTDDHGTMVAGIVGAAWDNGRGGDGVDPWLGSIEGRATVVDIDHSSWGRQLQDIVTLLLDYPEVRVVNNSYGLSNTYGSADDCARNTVFEPFRPDQMAFGQYDRRPENTICFVDRDGNGVPDPGRDEIYFEELDGVDLDVDGSNDTWAQVISHWGDVYHHQLSPTEIRRQDFFIVASAGNAGGDFNAVDNSPIANAADRFGSHFISVESIDWNNRASDFTTIGGSIAAPGHCVRSTESNDGINFDDDPCRAGVDVVEWVDGGAAGEEGRYATSSGTSFAAPFVTGVIAALWTLEPTLDVEQVRELLLYPARTVTTDGGTQPRIDAFAAAMGIDEVVGTDVLQRTLVDVDDGTLDGNQRTTLDEDGVVTDFDGWGTRGEAGDGRRGDGVISMADLRAFRDALTQTLLEEQPGMASAVSLDGGPAHFRRDLNFDGCVYHREVDPPHPHGTITTPAAGDCEDAPDENLFPRYDFNGDGRIGHQTAPFHGAELTDLQVLQAVWPDDNPTLNEGWRAEDLDDLITGANGAGGSADLHLRPLYPLEDTDAYDQVRLSIPELSMERLLTGDVPEIVWTVPVLRELTLLAQGIRDGEPVEDLCATASLGDLLLGEYRRVTVAPSGVMITVTPDMRTRKLSAVCDSYEFDEELVDYGPGEAVVVNCPRLDSGDSCALTREFSLEYGTGSLDVVVIRLDTTRFSITLNALGTPEIPPYPDAPSPSCGGLCGGGERVPCFASALVGFEIDAVLWTGIEGPTHHDVSCSAGSECVATSDLPYEYERFCFDPEWSEERAAIAVYRGSSTGGTWPNTPLDGCSASFDNSEFYYGIEPLALDGGAAFDTDPGSGGA